MTGDEAARRRFHEQNRRSWNAVTPVHNSHKADQARYLRGGGLTVFEEELELLGDPAGLRIAHLQCNCGQDSLSLAALGARVTGVDIADEAIAFAEFLSRESGISAHFVRSDLFDYFDSTPDRYDVAFATYGTIGWLCDLGRWARGVARILVDGGRLVFLEFHPLIWSLGRDGLTGDPYFVAKVIEEAGGVGDYVGEALAPSGYREGIEGFENPEPGFSFQWTVADIVQSLADAGLVIETMREYPYTVGCKVFDGMRPVGERRFALPEEFPALPLMLGLVASRNAARR